MMRLRRASHDEQLVLRIRPDPAKLPKKALTLTTLPDVPLLRVLALLPAADLVTVASVRPRLCELVRANRALWQHKRARFQAVDGLEAVLQFAPPWDTVEVRTDLDGSGAGVEIDFFSTRTLVVRVASELTAAEVVARLGPRANHLRVYSDLLRPAAAVPLLRALQRARNLETLRLRWDWSASAPNAAWPPSAALPLLHSVELDCAHDSADGEHACLRELLRAHRSQLVCVSLYAPRLLPLLEMCPDNLKRLTVAVDPGLGHSAALAAGLRRLHSLKELKITRMEEEYKLAPLLRAWSGPLLSLRLPSCSRETAAALGAGALRQLEYLQLNGPVAVGALAAALPGLPRLRSLCLRYAPAPDELRDLPAAAIPALCYLTILRDKQPADACSARLAAVALHALLQRAPEPLHVVRPALPYGAAQPPAAASSTASSTAPVPTHMYARHQAAESPLCPLCVEARETMALLAPGAKLHYVRLAADGRRQ